MNDLHDRFGSGYCGKRQTLIASVLRFLLVLPLPKRPGVGARRR